MEGKRVGQSNEGTRRDEDFFGKTAVAIDPEQGTFQTKGFLAHGAELAHSAENIGLDGHTPANCPTGNPFAERRDHA